MYKNILQSYRSIISMIYIWLLEKRCQLRLLDAFEYRTRGFDWDYRIQVILDERVLEAERKLDEYLAR